jgi:polyphenol oxidase
VSAILSEARFVHGFTTRGGALSGLAELGLTMERVATVSQVHGSTVVTAPGDPRDFAAFRATEADAIVLAGPQAGAVRVADCVPVVIGDDTSGRAAAIHAGWRGVASGVVPAAVAALRAKPTDLIAAIGPCIGACCFEVGEEVADQIAFAVPAPGVEVRRSGGKAWLDLAVAVRAQLEACGVTRVDRVGGCTRCDASMYDSFRRDGPGSGRMMGVIVGRAAG